MKPVCYNPVFLIELAFAHRKAFRKKNPKTEDYISLKDQRATHLLKDKKPDYKKVYEIYCDIVTAYKKAGNWHKTQEYQEKAAVYLAKHISECWSRKYTAQDDMKQLLKLLGSTRMARDNALEISRDLFRNLSRFLKALQKIAYTVDTKIGSDITNGTRYKIAEMGYEIAEKLVEYAPDVYQPRVISIVLGSRLVAPDPLIPEESTGVSARLDRNATKLIDMYRALVDGENNIRAANEIASALNNAQVPNDISSGRVTKIWNVSVPY